MRKGSFLTMLAVASLILMAAVAASPISFSDDSSAIEVADISIGEMDFKLYKEGTNPVKRTATLINSGSLSGDITIPDVTTYNGEEYEVTNFSAFKNNTAILSVKLSKNISEMPVDAFRGCKKLTSVTLSDNVDSIPNYAFQGTTALSSITLPDNISSIGNYAFSESGIGSVSIPASVTSIGNYAFNNAAKLSEVTFIEGSANLSLGNNVFYKCSALVSVALPDNVIALGNNVFGNCTSLTEVQFGSGLEQLGTSPFDGCTSLEKISVDAGNNAFESADGILFDKGKTELIMCPIGFTGDADGAYNIPDTVLKVSNYAFRYSNIKSIVIPDSVTEIGNLAFRYSTALETVEFTGTGNIDFGTYVFANCTALESFTFGAGITDVGAYMFDECSSLKQVTFGDDTKNFGVISFRGCTALESFVVPDGNGSLALVDSVLFNNEKTELILCPLKKEGNYTVPETVKSINAYAFYECTLLGSVTIPDSVESIGNYAFYGCTSLTSADVKGTPAYGTYTFSKSALTSFEFKDGTISIGDNIFRECKSLKSVILPADLSVIGGSWFYQASALSEITIPDGVTSIGTNAFRYTAVENLVIPESVREIKSYAFGNSGVVTLKICGPASIENYAFSSCSKLTSVEFCDAAKLNAQAFSSTTEINEVIVAPGSAFNANALFRTAPLNAQVKTDADTGYSYLDVKIRNGDGNLDDGKLVMDLKNSKILQLKADYAAIAYSALSSNITSVTVDSDNIYFTNDGSALYCGTELVFVLPGTTSLTIKDGTTKIGASSLDGCKADVIVLPSSVNAISPWAKTSFNDVQICMGPGIDISGTQGLDSSNTYYPVGTDLSGLDAAGFYSFAGDNAVLFKVNDPNCAIEITGSTDDAVAFDVKLADNYGQSDITVKIGNTVILKKSSYSLDGTIVKDSYIIGEIYSTTVVDISGVHIDTYKVSGTEAPGYSMNLSAGGFGTDIDYGTELYFSVYIDAGYEPTGSFEVSVTNSSGTKTVLTSYDEKGGYYFYTFTLTDNSKLSVAGVEPKAEVTVTFNSGEGSSVDPQKIPSYGKATAAEPTRADYVFAGWYLDSDMKEVYDFNRKVTSDITLYAGWFPDATAEVTLEFPENVTALINGYRTVMTGESVYKGSIAKFTFAPKYGYEVQSWTVNGAVTESCKMTFETVISGETKIGVNSEYTATGSYIDIVDLLTPTENDYYAAWTYVDASANASGMVFSGMTYGPAIIGDYVYAKTDNVLIKLDVKTGTLIDSVETAPSFGGFYEYVTVGNGLVYDSITGKVFTQDLEQLFVTDQKTIKAYYHDGLFYVEANGHIYAYSTVDEDPSDPENVQAPVFAVKCDVFITPYEGGGTMIFTEDFFMVSATSNGKVFLVTYENKTGVELDRIEIPQFEGLNIGKGYISISDGVAYMTAYGAGLFESAGGNIYNIARVNVDSNGIFDNATFGAYSSMTGNGFCSTFIAYGDYGYVNANEVMQVWDLKTMTVIASAPSWSSHGSMAISVGHPGYVYMYLQSYNTTTDLYVYKHNLSDPDTLESFVFKDVSLKQWGSQQVHFAKDGELLYRNDAGGMYCIISKATVTAEYSNGMTESVILNKGYEFVANIDGYTAKYFSDSGFTVPADVSNVTSDITVYVKLTAVDSTIDFYRDGTLIQSIVKPTGETVGGCFPEINESKTGYRQSWFGEDGEELIAMPQKMPGGTVAYHFEWTPVEKSYTVLYLDAEGNVLESKEVPSYFGAEVDPSNEIILISGYYFHSAPESFTVGISAAGNVLSIQYEAFPKITWVIDGEEYSETYDFGVMPKFKGDTDKDSDVRYTYTFSGWSPEVVAVTADATYTAQYDEVLNQYTVTFLDAFGDVFCTETVEYGSDATAPTGTPTKTTRTSDFVFKSWSNMSNVTSDISVTPTFTETPATMMSMTVSVSYDSMIYWSPYTVTFNENGFDLRDYGYTKELASAVGVSPKLTHLFVAAHEDEFGKGNVSTSFVFSKSGWTTTFWGITFDYDNFLSMTYFLDGVMTEDTHNDVVVKDGSYAECNLYNYLTNGSTTFDKQDVEALINTDITLTIPANPEIPYYLPAISFEGSKFYYSLTGVKDKDISGLTYMGIADEEGSFTFRFAEAGTYYVCAYRAAEVDESGFIADPFGGPISWCVVTINSASHTITWSVNGEETQETYAHNELPTFKGSTDREGNAKYTYEFTGWSPEITEATGDQVYVAQYAQSVNQCRVSFNVNGGSAIDALTVDYGTVFHPADPTKPNAVFQGWYVDPDFGVVYNQDVEVTADVALYAKWKIQFDSVPSAEDIADIVNSSDSSTIEINLSAEDLNVMIDNSAFQNLNGKKLVMRVGTEYSWEFSGDSVDGAGIFRPGINLADVDADIKSAADSLGVKDPMVIEFSASGQMPAKTKVTYNVAGTYIEGEAVDIYYYNPATKTLDKVAVGVVVDSDLNVTFGITHCSKYVLATEAESIIPSPGSSGDNTIGVTVGAAIGAAIGAMIMIAVAHVLISRRG